LSVLLLSLPVTSLHFIFFML